MDIGMRKIVTALLVAGLLLVAPGIQAKKLTDDAAFQSTIDILTACSGYYSWLEGFERKAGKPSTADFVHNINNGASMAASYMLALQYNEANPNGPARPWSYWNSLVEARAESNKTRMMSAVENGKIDIIKTQDAGCKAMAPFIKKVLRMIRKQAATATP